MRLYDICFNHLSLARERIRSSSRGFMNRASATVTAKSGYLASRARAAMTLSTRRVPMDRIAARYAFPDSPYETEGVEGVGRRGQVRNWSGRGWRMSKKRMWMGLNDRKRHKKIRKSLDDTKTCDHHTRYEGTTICINVYQSIYPPS